MNALQQLKLSPGFTARLTMKLQPENLTLASVILHQTCPQCPSALGQVGTCGCLDRNVLGNILITKEPLSRNQLYKYFRWRG